MFFASVLDIVVTGYKPVRVVLGSFTALDFLFWLGVAAILALGAGKYVEWLGRRFREMQKAQSERGQQVDRKIKDLENMTASRINAISSATGDLTTRISGLESVVGKISTRLSDAEKSTGRSSKDS